MRIGVNTRLLLEGRLDGIGWFACETLRRMVASHPEHSFYFFFDRKPSEHFIFASNVVPIVVNPPARHPILWWLFFECGITRALKRYNIDLFLSPDGFIPLHPKVPTLTVIHDLNFEHSDGNLKGSHQRYMTHYFRRFAKNATRVATVSEYSKQDIMETYGIDGTKVDVVYDGSHPGYRPHSEEEKQATRQLFTSGCPYIIFVSTILKRKNLANLLTAFEQVKNLEPGNLKLVVVGSKVWWQDELAKAYDKMTHKDDVIMPGHVDAKELAALMSASEALVYPSYFEGFGIPILEAMYAETAVICSNTTSMPEVGGDAVIYIDPHSPEDTAHAISNIQQPEIRNTLIEKGRRQRTKYSWERTANLLWTSMMHTIGKE